MDDELYITYVKCQSHKSMIEMRQKFIIINKYYRMNSIIMRWGSIEMEKSNSIKWNGGCKYLSNVGWLAATAVTPRALRRRRRRQRRD